MATGAQPLQLDTTANSGLFSLSVDLQPLRTAEEVAALQLALRRYPAGTPKRHEKIAGHLGREYTVEQVTGLIERLDRNSPAFLQLSSSLPQDGDAIYLIPPVNRCVACLEAPELLVQRRHVSPVVITEAGARGYLHISRKIMSQQPPAICPSASSTPSGIPSGAGSISSATKVGTSQLLFWTPRFFDAKKRGFFCSAY